MTDEYYQTTVGRQTGETNSSLFCPHHSANPFSGVGNSISWLSTLLHGHETLSRAKGLARKRQNHGKILSLVAQGRELPTTVLS